MQEKLSEKTLDSMKYRATALRERFNVGGVCLPGDHLPPIQIG
jgi:hypothetical protein